MLYCPVCRAPFKSLSGLKRHYQTTHVKTPRVCPVCGYTGSEDSVSRHLAHHAMKILRGDGCDDLAHAIHYILIKQRIHHRNSKQLRNKILPYLTINKPLIGGMEA